MLATVQSAISSTASPTDLLRYVCERKEKSEARKEIYLKKREKEEGRRRRVRVAYCGGIDPLQLATPTSVTSFHSVTTNNISQTGRKTEKRFKERITDDLEIETEIGILCCCTIHIYIHPRAPQRTKSIERQDFGTDEPVVHCQGSF